MSTRRLAHYVGITPLTRAQYGPLFAQSALYQSSAAVRSFVADVNGHPRTLMAALDMLLGDKAVEPSRPSLLDELRRRLQYRREDLDVPAELIVKALLRQEVSPSKAAAPGGLSYASYVAKV